MEKKLLKTAASFQLSLHHNVSTQLHKMCPIHTYHKKINLYMINEHHSGIHS